MNFKTSLISVSREFEPHQTFPLFLCSRNFTLAAYYWLVSEKDSSVMLQ